STPYNTVLAFDGAPMTPTAAAIPPDTMGAVGPTQFAVFTNLLLKTFDKGGSADNALYASPSFLFSSQMTELFGNQFVTSNVIGGPQVRYDRTSNRWFFLAVEHPCIGSDCSLPNRVMLAVTDASSNGVISAGTAWKLFSFAPHPSMPCYD